MNVYRICCLLLASLLFCGAAVAAPPAAQPRAVSAEEYNKALADFTNAFAAAEEARQRLAVIRPRDGKPDPIDCYFHPWRPGCNDIWTTLEQTRGPELSAAMEQHLSLSPEGSGEAHKMSPWKSTLYGVLAEKAFDYLWDVGVCLYKADGPDGRGLEGEVGMKKFGNCFVKPGITQGPGRRVVGDGSAAAQPDRHRIDPGLELGLQEVTVGKDEVWGRIRQAQAEAYKSAPSANKTQDSCVEPAGGQLAWFPLDDGDSPVSIDLIAGAQGKRRNGPQPAAGMVGRGLQFDGVANFVEVAGPDAAAFNVGTGDLSFEAWVRTGENRRGVHVLVEKRQPNPLRGYSFFLYDGKPAIQLADASGYSNYVSSVEVPADGRWHLVSASVRRSRLSPPGGQFYIDGAPAGQPFDPSNRPGDLANSAPLRLGSTTLAARPESVFHGALDEVGVFNRALSAEEVKRLHAAGAAGRCKYTAAEISLKVTVHMKCDNGKETTMVVTGFGSALDARDWALSNCDHKVNITASW